MLKRLFWITSMMFFMFCISGYAEEAKVNIVPVRTGETNTYLINVNYYNKDKDVINCIDPNQIYQEINTEYECILTVDNEEEKSIGKGKTNRFYKMDCGLYWDYIYKFDNNGIHHICAEIYKNGELIDDEDITINVEPAVETYAINNNEYLVNHSFEYRLINEINKRRDGNGLFNLGIKTVFSKLAEERLRYALSNNDFSHSDLDKVYEKYNINASNKREFYVKGTPSVEETLLMLLKNENAASCIYGQFRYISVCAASDDNNIMYWALEFYR